MANLVVSVPVNNAKTVMLSVAKSNIVSEVTPNENEKNRRIKIKNFTPFVFVGRTDWQDKEGYKNYFFNELIPLKYKESSTLSRSEFIDKLFIPFLTGFSGRDEINDVLYHQDTSNSLNLSLQIKVASSVSYDELLNQEIVQKSVDLSFKNTETGEDLTEKIGATIDENNDVVVYVHADYNEMQRLKKELNYLNKKLKEVNDIDEKNKIYEWVE